MPGNVFLVVNSAADPRILSRILIVHPGSQIKKLQKRGVKISCLLKIILFYERFRRKKINLSSMTKS